MGRLVEQSIPSIFNGVSRQPDLVRHTSQVEEADNTLFSVVTGGFEKRPPTKRVGLLPIDTNLPWHVYAICLDNSEKYYACIDSLGNVRVFDINTGAEKTVNAYSSAVRSYMTAPNPEHDLVLLTVSDFTFVLNKTVTVAMADSKGVVKGTAKKFEDLPGVRDYPRTGDVWRVYGAGEAADDIYYKWSGTAWVQTYTAANIPANLVVRGEKQTLAELPTAIPPDALDGDIWLVTNEDTRDDDYYVRWNDARKKWDECEDPTADKAFNLSTIPHALVQETNGTFSVVALNWNPRAAGDKDTVPEPKFVGRKLADIFFTKSRLGLVADSWTTLSQSSDFLNFWSQTGTQVLDDDPIDRSAENNKTTFLKFAVPFRKTVFLTSANAQFELSSDVYMTPSNTSVDMVTQYNASTLARPILVGDTMVFASKAQKRSILQEYYYDDNTISNTAADITKHVADYIPEEILKMTADPTTGIMWCYSSGDTSSLYVYTSYWDGEKKLQSAWCRWPLHVEKVYDITFMDGYLYLVVKRSGLVHLERVAPVREASAPGLNFDPLLDCRTEVTGVYSAETNTTTFTLPFFREGRTDVVLGGSFGNRKGMWLRAENATDNANSQTITFAGNYSGGVAYAGLRYLKLCELSKPYLKDEAGTAIITGRLQLRTMMVSYTDSSYFMVRKTPKARDAKVYKFTGRILGSEGNVMNGVAKETGVFRFPVNSRGDTVKIEFLNDSPYPSCITALSWTGFFNEISRQDKG